VVTDLKLATMVINNAKYNATITKIYCDAYGKVTRAFAKQLGAPRPRVSSNRSKPLIKGK